jgi:menaquinone-dependent protoporphyrinogen IX oxidase
MGPLTLSDEDVADARKQLEKGLGRPGVVPDLTAIFGGVIDPGKLRFPLNHMLASDARDWTAIHAWAAQVATEIARRVAA